jgi:hypothetical protein
MTKAACLLGLDVHARQTHAGVLNVRSGELVVGRLVGAPEELASCLERLRGRTVAVHEAGPTGFGWRARRGDADWTCGSWRRGRSSEVRATESRRTVMTRSGWCGFGHRGAALRVRAERSGI